MQNFWQSLRGTEEIRTGIQDMWEGVRPHWTLGALEDYTLGAGVNQE